MSVFGDSRVGDIHWGAKRTCRLRRCRCRCCRSGIENHQEAIGLDNCWAREPCTTDSYMQDIYITVHDSVSIHNRKRLCSSRESVSNSLYAVCSLHTSSLFPLRDSIRVLLLATRVKIYRMSYLLPGRAPSLRVTCAFFAPNNIC